MIEFGSQVSTVRLVRFNISIQSKNILTYKCIYNLVNSVCIKVFKPCSSKVMCSTWRKPCVGEGKGPWHPPASFFPDRLPLTTRRWVGGEIVPHWNPQLGPSAWSDLGSAFTVLEFRGYSHNAVCPLKPDTLKFFYY